MKQASALLPDGSYCRKHSAVPFDSQDTFMHQSPHIPAEPIRSPETLRRKLEQLAAKLSGVWKKQK